MVEHICQNPSCQKITLLQPYWAKRRKYCCFGCGSTHQKILGIRKGQKPNSLDKMIEVYGKEEGEIRYKIMIEKIRAALKGRIHTNRTYTPSEETKKRIAETRKKTNLKIKLEKEGIKKEKYNENLINFDSKKGEGAYNKLKEKMKGVFSLPWFIQKYGDIEGTKKYTERCANIKKTTYFKEYNKLNRNNYSNISKELFDMIAKFIPADKKYYYAPFNHEYSCGTPFNFDFVIPDDKKAIEFNGDKFHANPKLYQDADYPNPYMKTLSSAQIWAYDTDKIKAANNNGYQVLVIWESDFKNNPEKILQECLSFLNYE
jgi:hypothetical protein